MKRLLRYVLPLALFCAMPSLADDVEIYFNYSGASSGAPLVMFSLDYRPNLGSNICAVSSTSVSGGSGGASTVVYDFSACGWNADFSEFNAFFTDAELGDGVIQFFDMLRAALRYVFGDPELANSGMHLGLMLNHDHRNNCAGPDNARTAGCSNGGYIADGLTSLSDGGFDELDAKLLAIPTPQGNVSHSYQGKELYFELFRYLTGQDIFNGHVGHTDYGDACGDDNLDDASVVASCAGGDSDYPLAAWDESVETNSHRTYVSPLTDAFECSKIHVLNFMFGVANQHDDSDAAIQADRADGGMGISLGNGRNEQFRQMLSALRSVDLGDGTWGTVPSLEGMQNVTSYFIHNGQNSNTLNGWGLAGGGGSIEVGDDPRALTDALRNAFLTILRQNSTFEAPAVTVNSYNRLAHRDEVFYALFGPELVRDWPGNLKKYKFAEIEIDDDGDGVTDRTVVAIVDRDSNVAIGNDGLFNVGACSFWSSCSPEDDGDNVEAGGAAENLGTGRHVYTYVGGTVASGGVTLSSGNDLHEDNAAITADMLGLTEAVVEDYDEDGGTDAADVTAARQAVLRIGRGVSEDDPTVALSTLGDPIHSRPAVIVYDGDVLDADSDGIIEPDLAIAMTTNEGYFHLFDGASGAELFSFMPKETLPLLWEVNKAEPADTDSGVNRYGTYGLDGSVIVLWKDVNQDEVITAADGDRVIAFLSQRRGGRNLYALDLTTKSTPKLLWHIEGGVTTGFEELGETWSTPTLTKLREPDGSGGTKLTDVLVFGGGYDEDRYDRDASDPDDDNDIGRAVYVVEALTGTRRFAVVESGTASSTTLVLSSMADSIPAQVQVLDLYDDGVMDRLYFSDIRGRIFRVDFDNNGTTTTLHGGGLVATLTDPADCTDVTASPNPCRLFYNSLDVAIMTGFPRSPYIQLAIGSGFRAHPKDKATQDRFYVVYDEQVVRLLATNEYAGVYGANGFDETTLTDVSTIDTGTFSAVSAALTETLTNTAVHGWRFDLNQGIGEKVLSESVTIGGQLFFTTYAPEQVGAANVCAPNLGEGRIYLVNAFNGLPEATLGGDALTGYDDINLLESGDDPSESNRWQLLPRQGMPTDPTVVFKEKSDGTIEPNLVVGTQLPLPADLIKTNPVRQTWWLEE